MNMYEIAVVYHPDLEVDLSKATAKIEKILKDAGGKIAKTDSWGKRKLAYTVAKQDHGIYVFYTVELDPLKIDEIDNALRIADEVIRYLITKPDLKAIAKAEEAKEKRDKRIGKSPKPDEENEDDEK